MSDKFQMKYLEIKYNLLNVSLAYGNYFNTIRIITKYWISCEVFGTLSVIVTLRHYFQELTFNCVNCLPAGDLLFDFIIEIRMANIKCVEQIQNESRSLDGISVILTIRAVGGDWRK